MVSSGGLFFWDLLFVVDGDGEYFFGVLSAVVVGSSFNLGFVFSFFFGVGLWVLIFDG